MVFGSNRLVNDIELVGARGHIEFYLHTIEFM